MTVQALAICPLVGLLVLFGALRGLALRERRLVVAAFVAHVVAAFALVAYHVHIYRGGDMMLYAEIGRQIAYVLDGNEVLWGPELVKLALQLDNAFPVDVLLEGTSTGTMSAFAGVLIYVVGDTLYGCCLLVSFFSFWGSVCLYRAARWKLRGADREAALVGLLLMPSVLFWTSGIVKEAFVFGFIGLVCKGLVDVLARRRAVAIVPLVIGIEGIAITKPYVLVSLAAAVGAWFYAGSERKLGFAYKLLSIVIVLTGVVLVAQRFPDFSPENVLESIAHTRESFDLVQGGGSNIGLAGGGEGASAGTQLLWAPVGLLNSLARPFLFEVRNASMAIAAVEMTVIVVFIGSLMSRVGFGKLLRELARDPVLLSAAVFVLSFATAVGLATKNLGSLSRYRVPMLPMYGACVLILRARASPPRKPKVKVGRLARGEAPLARRGHRTHAGTRRSKPVMLSRSAALPKR